MQVHLNGGPMHDMVMELPDKYDHFHVNGFPDQRPEMREGMYSRVTGPNNRHEFEWDGWRSHD